MTSLGIEAEAAEFGFYKISANHGVRWAIACSCGTTPTFGWRGNTSPELMVKNMRQKGWRIVRRKPPVCDACQQREPDMQKTPAAPPVNQVAAKIARSIYAKLDEVFDEARRMYVGGWTDERVAKELDTSPDLIARIRREAYGELAEDPKITALRDDIELAKMAADDEIKKLSAAVMAKLSELEQRVNAARGVPHKAGG